MTEPQNQGPVARPQRPVGKTAALAIRDFKDLIVWQRAMDAAAEIYRLARKLPREETFALGDQLRRAVVSIPSNIGRCRSCVKSAECSMRFLPKFAPKAPDFALATGTWHLATSFDGVLQSV